MPCKPKPTSDMCPFVYLHHTAQLVESPARANSPTLQLPLPQPANHTCIKTPSRVLSSITLHLPFPLSPERAVGMGMNHSPPIGRLLLGGRFGTRTLCETTHLTPRRRLPAPPLPCPAAVPRSACSSRLPPPRSTRRTAPCTWRST